VNERIDATVNVVIIAFQSLNTFGRWDGIIPRNQRKAAVIAATNLTDKWKVNKVK
jgi:hypothetical protein